MCVCLCRSFVDSEIQTSLSTLYKCSDVLARRVQEHALAAMFGELFTSELILYIVCFCVTYTVVPEKFMQHVDLFLKSWIMQKLILLYV